MASENQSETDSSTTSNGWGRIRIGCWTLLAVPFVAFVAFAVVGFTLEEMRLQEISRLQDEMDAARASQDYESAIQAVNRLIELEASATLSNRLPQRAELYRDQGDYDSALADINAAIKFDTDMYERMGLDPLGMVGYLYGIRGTIYHRMGKDVERDADWSRARAEGANIDNHVFFEFFPRWIECTDNGDHKTALAIVDEWLACLPTSDDAFYSRMISHKRLGNYKSALNDIRQAIELNPAEARYFRARADLYEAVGDSSSAKQDRARFQKLKNSKPEIKSPH
jgi:tetratricopeptide (TPR) repeat protein